MADVTDYQAADVAVGTRLSALLTWRPLESWQTVLAGGVAVLMAAALSLVLTGKDPASAATFVTSVTRGEIVYADGSRASGDHRGARARRRLAAHRRRRRRAAHHGRPGRLPRRPVHGRRRRRRPPGPRARPGDGRRELRSRADPRHVGRRRHGHARPPGRSPGSSRTSGPCGWRSTAAQASITAEGRRATTTVGALHQVRVPYGGVPEAPTALALTIKNGVYDTWEQRLAARPGAGRHRPQQLRASASTAPTGWW